MDESQESRRHDEPTESGALEPEQEGDLVAEPPRRDEPTESGALEDEPRQ